MAKSARKEAPELNINLLPEEKPSGATGLAVHWTLTVGRYLVIFTEIVALAIFALGIKLAADKNALKEDIKNLSAQVDEQKDFEQNFRLIQQRVQEVSRLQGIHFENNGVISQFLALLPKDLTLNSLSINNNQISFSGSFATPEQLQTLVASFSRSDKITGLDISKLDHPNDINPLYTFEAKAFIIQSNFTEGKGK